MKRLIIRVVWLIGLLGFGFSLYMHIRGKDIPPQDYPDLVVERVEVPEAENGFSLFIAAAEQSTFEMHKDILEAYLKNQGRESEFLELMIENTVALGLLKKGVERGFCQPPELHSLTDVAPYVTDWVKFSKFLAASSQYLRKQGQLDQATGKSILLLRFSGRVYADPESMIQCLVGLACLNSGLAEAQELARNPDTTVNELQDLQQTLVDLPPLRPAMILTMKQEYKFLDNMIRDMGEGGPSIDVAEKGKTIVPSKYMFQPNQTRATAAVYYLGWLEEGQKPYSEIDFNRFELEELPKGKIRRILRPNPIGYLLLSVLLPAQDGFIRGYFRAETHLQATRLIVALQLLKREEGDFPEQLGDLRLPDPFDGKNFRYDPDQRIVYSVGQNGTDEGGSENLISGTERENEKEEKRRWNAEDAVFHLE